MCFFLLPGTCYVRPVGGLFSTFTRNDHPPWPRARHRSGTCRCQHRVLLQVADGGSWGLLLGARSTVPCTDSYRARKWDRRDITRELGEREEKCVGDEKVVRRCGRRPTTPGPFPPQLRPMNFLSPFPCESARTICDMGCSH